MLYITGCYTTDFHLKQRSPMPFGFRLVKHAVALLTLQLSTYPVQSSSHLQQLKVSASHLTGNCHTINTSTMFANRTTTTYVPRGSSACLFQMMWQEGLP